MGKNGRMSDYGERGWKKEKCPNFNLVILKSENGVSIGQPNLNFFSNNVWIKYSMKTPSNLGEGGEGVIPDQNSLKYDRSDGHG